MTLNIRNMLRKKKITWVRKSAHYREARIVFKQRKVSLKKICINFLAFVLGFIHLNWALVGEVTVAVISGNVWFGYLALFFIKIRQEKLLICCFICSTGCCDPLLHGNRSGIWNFLKLSIFNYFTYLNNCLLNKLL